MQTKKANVEAIYPLNFLQQALLFHSLQEDIDQGFLRVKCVLKGKIDLEAFQNAWRQNIQRHEVLRTSVHWEKLEKPVQVVHKEVELPFNFLDWSQISDADQKLAFNELINSNGAESLSLSKAPVLKIFLLRLSLEKHILLWNCHHILLDGWSASIILQDLLANYDANCSGENSTELPAVASYKSYLNWVKNQDGAESTNFWTEVLKNFERPTLVGNRKQSQKSLKNNFETKSIKLSQEQSQKLRDFSQKSQITLNTLIQGIWAILLSRYVEHEDIAFGTIVSGRSIDLPNAERMVGMYMNVLPLRIRLNDKENFSDWLKSLQSQQGKVRGYEFCNLDEIINSGNSAGGNLLFDSVVVFENMPLENIRGAGVSIESFESGLTSTYAVTLAVSPLREIKASIQYDASIVSEKQISWFVTNLSKMFEIVTENKSLTLEELGNFVSPSAIQDFRDQYTDIGKTFSNGYLAPGNDLELKLLRIWERLLNVQPIGVTEDFFALGGTSINAISLFTEIKKQFNRNLQPIALLEHSTIRALSELIKDETKDEPWSALVPLRASGSKPPLFCFHGGGGHVLYLKDLAKHLGADQPVYGLQKLGLNEDKPIIYDVKTMASHYLSEIRKVQPKGPYCLMGYCLSTPVCYEIALQLDKIGEECAFVGMIDSRITPLHPLAPETTKQRIKRIAKMIYVDGGRYLTGVLQRKVIKPIGNKLVYLKSSREVKKERDLWEMTNKVLLEYVWEAYPGKITIIATKERQENQYLRLILDDWTPLAKGGLDVFVVSANHKTIFYEPEVEHLAEQIRQCLDKANQ
ncbi:MAG: non-ribosomal peptide synthetase [Flavobacterium sp.]|nr:MAG: non-ribosomal peptide synthetase [Flavobacterium sp.]